MSAVFKKEFSQLFHSMIGYVCLAVFAAITGYYFFTLNRLPHPAMCADIFLPLLTSSC